MTAIARWTLAALDCPDPYALARFYSAVTGLPVSAESEDDWVELDAGSGPTLAFQLAPGHRPPPWPDEESSQQAHLDFEVDDVDAAEARVLALGARKAEVQPGESFRVYTDPAGHPSVWWSARRTGDHRWSDRV